MNPVDQEQRFDGFNLWIQNDRKNSRTQCILLGCNHLTHAFCTKCQVHLCFNQNRNCFRLFHEPTARSTTHQRKRKQIKFDVERSPSKRLKEKNKLKAKGNDGSVKPSQFKHVNKKAGIVKRSPSKRLIEKNASKLSAKIDTVEHPPPNIIEEIHDSTENAAVHHIVNFVGRIAGSFLRMTSK